MVRETLSKVHSLASAGSVIVQDFYSKSLVEGTAAGFKTAGKMVAKMGEPWLFGLEMSDDANASISTFVEDAGFNVGEVVLFGNKNAQTPPFHAVVEAFKA